MNEVKDAIAEYNNRAARPGGDPPEYYQDVFLKLDDGRTIYACVEAFCGFNGEPSPKIVGVEVHLPAKVPEGFFIGFDPKRKEE